MIIPFLFQFRQIIDHNLWNVLKILKKKIFWKKYEKYEKLSYKTMDLINTGGDLETKIWKSQNCDFFSVF